MKKFANLQLIYVSDIEASSTYYSQLFCAEPEFISPRYVAFRTSDAEQPLFALWTGGNAPDRDAPRYSEIGMMLPTHQEVHDFYDACTTNSAIDVEQELYEEVFGPTFTIKDPDGHIIRVSPLD